MFAGLTSGVNNNDNFGGTGKTGPPAKGLTVLPMRQGASHAVHLDSQEALRNVSGMHFPPPVHMTEALDTARLTTLQQQDGRRLDDHKQG